MQRFGRFLCMPVLIFGALVSSVLLAGIQLVAEVELYLETH